MEKMRVLVVDDDPDFVDAIRSVLNSGGYEVLVAGDGEAGLRKAKKAKPNLIILDVMMPLREGYSVCRALKEDRETSRIPVLIVSAISKEAAGESYASKIAADHGADDFIEKPLGPEGLLGKIETLLVQGAASVEREEKKRVLIVDDDPHFVDAISHILKANGYEVLAASNGEEGVKSAKALLPDVILLDVILPDKDGFSVCYELKKESRTESIPIIFLTSVGKVLTKPEFAQDIAVDHLADDFADKPIDPGRLLRKIRKHVAPYY